MKKSTLIKVLICSLICLQAHLVSGQKNLILNPSFEQGTHPTGSNGIGNGHATYWKPGFTYNTGYTPGTRYGGTPDLLDYNIPAGVCGYGYFPNLFYASNTGAGTLPKHGERFALIMGGYTGVYAFNEGESILGQLHKFECPGNYILTFWAKAPDGYWQGTCSTGYFGYINYNIHPNNYVEVALRKSTDSTRNKRIYTTPTIINKGNWIKYSDTISITATDIDTFDRIEFRIDSAGAETSKKIAFIDSVSLVYYEPASAPPVYVLYDTIGCQESVDLDLINTHICDGYYDTWTLNGVPVSNIVTPGVNATYITKCRTCEGCVNFEVRVNITIASPSVDTETDTLHCDSCIVIAASACPSGTMTAMWSNSLGTNSTVTVCPNQDEQYIYTCLDSNGCPTHKSYRRVIYEECDQPAPIMEELGTKNINLEDAIMIYPNPTTETFTLTISGLNLNDVTYSITDISGKVITEDIRPTAAKMTISLLQNPHGIYLVNIHYKNKVITKKVSLK
ncbi:MAG: T9SS type A sorting domain-containing protein [Flavipsychrobacter sp.]|nr:T9SS type A sorting domain-containing protein [Flavipsychrobacter sp.]